MRRFLETRELAHNIRPRDSDTFWFCSRSAISTSFEWSFDVNSKNLASINWMCDVISATSKCILACILEYLFHSYLVQPRIEQIQPCASWFLNRFRIHNLIKEFDRHDVSTGRHLGEYGDVTHLSKLKKPTFKFRSRSATSSSFILASLVNSIILFSFAFSCRVISPISAWICSCPIIQH